MSYDRLLAKSVGRDGWWHDSMLLSVHLGDVHRAADEVLRCTARDQLAVVGLPADKYMDRFGRIVRMAAVLHDLGKANDHFQGMIHRKRDVQVNPQGLRHEWVTILMIHRDAWRTWLRPAVVEDVDLDLVAWAIAGHHPAHGRASPPAKSEQGAGAEVRLLMGHGDFAACIEAIAGALGLDPSRPACVDETVRLIEGATDGAFARIGRDFSKAMGVWAHCTDDSKRLLAAVKACLVAADVAGSALPRSGAAKTWVPDALANVPSREDLHGIVADRLDGKPLRAFQVEVASQASRVALARAGCGSGKTLAAYQWAAEQCPGRRLYVCYPTTGTATEGFRDYLFDAQEGKGKHGARLFHGRAEVDHDIILGVERDEDGIGTDIVNRLQSLDAWATPVVSCTVDTVLGLVQNHKKGLYAWPALAQSAFVFDEIHAYDEKLFGALLRFLSAMRGVRVLLMTASLPEPRLAALRRCLDKLGESLAEVAGPADLEQLPRYHRLTPADPRDPMREVRDHVAAGGKVLWVCNLVDRAMAFAARCADLQPFVYHSRFRYVDRVEQHKKVIKAFDPEQTPGAAVAICTQVAEMSLDLSATLLVTDRAPVPAMIQRLGRLNRRAKPLGDGGDGKTMPFLVVEPIDARGEPTHLPYDTSPEAYGDWLAASRAWLERIGTHDISQAQLASAWESADAAAKVKPCDSKWLDGGPRTEVDALRDATPGLTIFLQDDLPKLRSGELRIVEAAIPMPAPPRGRDWRGWEKFSHVPVAPPDAITYDRERGAAWRK